MQVIFVGSRRTWGFEFSLLHVHGTGQDEEDDDLRLDPHSTTAAHLERRSAVEDLYESDDKPRFGFCA